MSAGLDLSLFLTENYLIEDLANFVNERLFNLEANIKYYPFKFNVFDSLSIKPFASVGIGTFLIHNMDIPGGTPSCNELYRVSTNDYISTYFGLGIILFPENVNFIFDIKYLIRKPEIDFDKPICEDPVVGPRKSYERYSKTIDLDMLLFNFGVRINF